MVLCLVVVLVLLFPGICRAELYKYTDKEGIVHVTDNLADVPEEQRAEVEAYQELRDVGVTEKKLLQKDAADETSTRTIPGATPGPATQEKDPAVLEELEARRTDLDTERTQLERERAKLMEKGQELRATRAIWALNADFRELSGRFAAHQEKRNAFEEDWDAYYASLKDSPEVEKLKARHATLDMERIQLQDELSKLVEKERDTRQRRKIRWHKRNLQELNERIVAYQQKRDTFEKDWDAFYSSQ
jgi:hypothetical protein